MPGALQVPAVPGQADRGSPSRGVVLPRVRHLQHAQTAEHGSRAVGQQGATPCLEVVAQTLDLLGVAQHPFDGDAGFAFLHPFAERLEARRGHRPVGARAERVAVQVEIAPTGLQVPAPDVAGQTTSLVLYHGPEVGADATAAALAAGDIPLDNLSPRGLHQRVQLPRPLVVDDQVLALPAVHRFLGFAGGETRTPDRGRVAHGGHALVKLVVSRHAVRVGDPRRAGPHGVEPRHLGLGGPDVVHHAEHHGLGEPTCLEPFRERRHERSPQGVALRILVGRQVLVPRSARLGVEHRHHRPLAEELLPGGRGFLEPQVIGALLLALEHVDFPDPEADDLRRAHVLQGRVEIPVEDRQVVVVRAVGLLDPADHRLGVAQVRLGQQWYVQHAAAGLADIAEASGDHLPVSLGPRLEFVLEGQRVGRLHQFEPRGVVLERRQRPVGHANFERHDDRVGALGADRDRSLVESGRSALGHPGRDPHRHDRPENRLRLVRQVEKQAPTAGLGLRPHRHLRRRGLGQRTQQTGRVSVRPRPALVGNDQVLVAPRQGVAQAKVGRREGRAPGSAKVACGDPEAADRRAAADDDLAAGATATRDNDPDRREPLARVAEVEVEVAGHRVAVPDLQPRRPRRVGDQPDRAVGHQLHSAQFAGVPVEREPGSAARWLLLERRQGLVIRRADNLDGHDVDALSEHARRNRHVVELPVPQRQSAGVFLGALGATAERFAVLGQERLGRVGLGENLGRQVALRQMSPADFLAIDEDASAATIAERQSQATDFRRVGHAELPPETESGGVLRAALHQGGAAEPWAVVELRGGPLLGGFARRAIDPREVEAHRLGRLTVGEHGRAERDVHSPDAAGVEDDRRRRRGGRAVGIG